jgi:hypothetical protein
MKKGQKKFIFSYLLFFSIFFFLIFYLNVYSFIFQIFISKPFSLILIPTWFWTFLFHPINSIGKVEITNHIKERLFFYSLFITFLIFYYIFFSKSLPIIVAQTAPPPGCPYQGQPCGFGDCAGKWITVCQFLQGTIACGCKCDSEGRSCTPSVCCNGRQSCSCVEGSGTCDIGGVCKGGTPTSSCSCVSGQCGAECSKGDYKYDPACDYCYNHLYCNGVRGCDSDCKWSGCACPVPEECSCIVGKCSAECCKDADCPAYDPNTHLKMYCDTNTHTCQTIEKCGKNDECESNWCCDRDPSLPSSCKLSGSCVAKGTRMCNNKYICDPPEGFVSSSNENINTNTQTNKKLTLLDLLINPFSYFFKR